MKYKIIDFWSNRNSVYFLDDQERVHRWDIKCTEDCVILKNPHGSDLDFIPQNLSKVPVNIIPLRFYPLSWNNKQDMIDYIYYIIRHHRRREFLRLNEEIQITFNIMP